MVSRCDAGSSTSTPRDAPSREGRTTEMTTQSLSSVLSRVLLLALFLACATRVLATCGDTQNARDPFETYGGSVDPFCAGAFTKTLHWTVYWLDSNIGRNVNVADGGDSYTLLVCHRCYPAFQDPPTFLEVGTTAYWDQVTSTGSYDSGHNCNQSIGHSHRQGHTCGSTTGYCSGDTDYSTYSSTGCASGFVDLGGYCGRSYAFQSRCAGSGYDPDSCTCPDGTDESPIIIDVDHSGFSMTNAAGGVTFNLLNDGVPLQISWTAANSTNAFL